MLRTNDNSDGQEDGGNFELHREEGDFMFATKLWAKAADCYTAALDAKPGDRECLVQRSKAYIQLGNTDAALRDAEDSLQGNSTFHKGIYAKANALYFLGEFEMSLVFYHRGQKLRPDLEEFRLGIQKTQESIRNAVGDPKKIKLTKEGDLSYFDDLAKREFKSRRPPSSQSKSSMAKHKLVKPPGKGATKKVKVLLQEMYGDNVCLEKLLKDPVCKSGPPAVRVLVVETLELLKQRTEFWYQQKEVTRHGKKEIVMNMCYMKQQIDYLDNMVLDKKHVKVIKRCKKLIAAVDKWYSDVPREEMLGRLHSYMGSAHHEQQHYTKAIEHFERDLTLGREHNLIENQTRGLLNLGRLYTAKQQYNEAIVVWKDAIQVSMADVDIVWVYHELGHCYLELGKGTEANKYGESSLQLAQTLGDRHQQMNALVLIGQAQILTKELTPALHTLTKALDTAIVLKDVQSKHAIMKKILSVQELMGSEDFQDKQDSAMSIVDVLKSETDQQILQEEQEAAESSESVTSTGKRSESSRAPSGSWRKLGNLILHNKISAANSAPGSSRTSRTSAILAQKSKTSATGSPQASKPSAVVPEKMSGESVTGSGKRRDLELKEKTEPAHEDDDIGELDVTTEESGITRRQEEQEETIAVDQEQTAAADLEQEKIEAVDQEEQEDAERADEDKEVSETPDHEEQKKADAAEHEETEAANQEEPEVIHREEETEVADQEQEKAEAADQDEQEETETANQEETEVPSQEETETVDQEEPETGDQEQLKEAKTEDIEQHKEAESLILNVGARSDASVEDLEDNIETAREDVEENAETEIEHREHLPAEKDRDMDEASSGTLILNVGARSQASVEEPEEGLGAAAYIEQKPEQAPADDGELDEKSSGTLVMDVAGRSGASIAEPEGDVRPVADEEQKPEEALADTGDKDLEEKSSGTLVPDVAGRSGASIAEPEGDVRPAADEEQKPEALADTGDKDLVEKSSGTLVPDVAGRSGASIAEPEGDVRPAADEEQKPEEALADTGDKDLEEKSSGTLVPDVARRSGASIAEPEGDVRPAADEEQKPKEALADTGDKDLVEKSSGTLVPDVAGRSGASTAEPEGDVGTAADEEQKAEEAPADTGDGDLDEESSGTLVLDVAGRSGASVAEPDGDVATAADEEQKTEEAPANDGDLEEESSGTLVLDVAGRSDASVAEPKGDVEPAADEEQKSEEAPADTGDGNLEEESSGTLVLDVAGRSGASIDA